MPSSQSLQTADLGVRDCLFVRFVGSTSRELTVNLARAMHDARGLLCVWTAAAVANGGLRGPSADIGAAQHVLQTRPSL